MRARSVPCPQATAGETLSPSSRRRHGVYATPPSLVGYLVRSIHRLLQEKLGWAAGLADRRVRLLDPAAGTMNFVRAAWRLALEAHWHRGREVGELLREHLLPHSLGIEALPAIHARGLVALRRFLTVHGYPSNPGAPLPLVLADALAPATRTGPGASGFSSPAPSITATFSTPTTSWRARVPR